MSFLIGLGILVAIALYGIVVYNRLVSSRQMVEEGWSGIDVQLKRRANLIPNLVSAVKGYMKHEREVLEDVTKLRARAKEVEDGTPAQRSQAEQAVSGALLKLFAVMENYPDLKANQNVLELQASLKEVEDQIQLSRRYYNGSVRNNNILIESFPSNLVANWFRFIKAEFFEITDDADRQVPKVEL